MNPRLSLVALIISSFGVKQTLECSLKNISCNGIKTAAGYEFRHGFSGGREIYIYHNETLIAYSQMATQSFTLWKGVLKMDNYSVITEDCRDLTVKLIGFDRLGFVKETCVNFLTAEDRQRPDTSYLAKTWVLIILSVFICGALLCGCYVIWKKILKKQRGTATDTEFLRKILTCSCASNRTFQPNARGREETRNRNEFQLVRAGDLEIPHNNDIQDEQSSDGSPRGSGAPNIERDNTLESVLVQSIDALDDGPTSRSLRLDHHLSNDGIQPTENGTIRGPDANRAAHHRTMNRNLRDDPGGVNSHNKEDISREMDGKRPVGAGGSDAEDQETDGRLLNQRAAVRSSDRTGEAIALVNKHSFDLEHVSRCSTAPDTDVESHEELQVLVQQ